MTPARRAALVLLTAAALVPAGAALAKDGGGGDRAEARASGSCPGGGRWELRARARDGAIDVDLRARTARTARPASWRVVVLHERRIAWRATVRAGSGGLRVRRSLPDYPGPETVAARAAAPGGGTCVAQVDLPAGGS